MSPKITTTTDVRYLDVAHERGTTFEVTDEPAAQATPPQVDPETARRWLRDGWAEGPGDKSAP